MVIAVDQIVLSLDEMAAAIRSTFDMESGQAPALRARLKHMQKLGFPKPGVRKGFVAAYGAEDLVKVAVAFTLLEAGMPSVRACALVSSVWSELARSIAAPGMGAVPKLAVRPHALTTVGVRGLAKQDKAEKAMIGDDFGTEANPRFSATTVTVDVRKLLQRLEGVMTGEGGKLEGLNQRLTVEQFRSALAGLPEGTPAAAPRD